MDKFALQRAALIARNTTPFKSAIVFLGQKPYSGGDHLCNGLSLLLGPENVHRYPFEHIYTMGYDIDRNAMFMRNDDLWKSRRDSPLAKYRVREIIQKTPGLFAALESTRPDALKAYMELKPLLKEVGIPIVFLDGDESDSFPMQRIKQIEPDLIAKGQAVLPSITGFSKVAGIPIVPMAHAIPDQLLPLYPVSKRRKFIFDAVACMSAHNHADRPPILKALRATSYDVLAVGAGTEPKAVRDAEFLHVLRASRLGVSVRGSGRRNFARWDILQHTALFADGKQRWFTRPLVDGKEYVAFDGPKEFIEKLDYYLLPENVKLLDGIYRAGLAVAAEHHTSSARALAILKALQKK